MVQNTFRNMCFGFKWLQKRWRAIARGSLWQITNKTSALVRRRVTWASKVPITASVKKKTGSIVFGWCYNCFQSENMSTKFVCFGPGLRQRIDPITRSLTEIWPNGRKFMQRIDPRKTQAENRPNGAKFVQMIDPIAQNSCRESTR